MNDPILKSHWERFKAHVVLDLPTVKKLIAPYTSASIETIQWLSEGCANTNYKIIFTNQQPPVVLRIYTREKSALGQAVGAWTGCLIMKSSWVCISSSGQMTFIYNTQPVINEPSSLCIWRTCMLAHEP